MLCQIRIYDFYGRKKHALPNDMDKTLDDANIQMDQEGNNQTLFFWNLQSQAYQLLEVCLRPKVCSRTATQSFSKVRIWLPHPESPIMSRR